MNELMKNLFAQTTNGRSLMRQASQLNSLKYEEDSHQFPYRDIIANLFNNEPSATSVGIASAF